MYLDETGLSREENIPSTSHQMYLDETGLSREENIPSTSPLLNISSRKLNTSQEHIEDLQDMSLDHYWQEKELDFHNDNEVSLNVLRK
jgi:hypothetical protein